MRDDAKILKWPLRKFEGFASSKQWRGLPWRSNLAMDHVAAHAKQDACSHEYASTKQSLLSGRGELIIETQPGEFVSETAVRRA